MTLQNSSPGRTPVAFVAGGSGGLGQAVCRCLAASHHVVLTYRAGRAAAEELVQELRRSGMSAEAWKADLLEDDEIENALTQATLVGPLKALVYAAGPTIEQKYFSRVNRREWTETAAAEIEAFFTFMAVALPVLRKSAGASIVAITSFATTRVVPGDVLSAVPKASMEMLVRQISREEGRFGIRANCVAPGIVDAGLGLYTQRTSYTPEIWDRQREKVPLRRFGTAEDIANAVAFFVSDEASYVTGQTINVDGGMSV